TRLTQATLLFAALGASVLFAQVDRAVLEGTVTDQSGGVLIGARVQAMAVDTGIAQEKPTNANGYYRPSRPAVGRYTVNVNREGFQTMVVNDVILEVGQTRTLDLRLSIGAVTERVEVTAVGEPAERSSAEASTVIRTDQILNLPNNGRDWASFTLLA